MIYRKLYIFFLLVLLANVSGCAYNLLDKPEEAAAAAPVPEIVITKSLTLISEDGNAVLDPGVYVPLRRFGGGTLFMKEDKIIRVGSDQRERIGAIYWKDGLESPDSYCYYLSEFVPKIVETKSLSHIKNK